MAFSHFRRKFWCIHNLNLNEILIACKFTVCKLENSQSETYNSICWLRSWLWICRAFPLPRLTRTANWMASKFESERAVAHCPVYFGAELCRKQKTNSESLASRSNDKFIVTNFHWVPFSPVSGARGEQGWMLLKTNKLLKFLSSLIEEPLPFAF